MPIPVYAEMGSINPIVVTEAALRERGEKIAEGLTASVANFGGQLCTKPGVVFVPAGEAGDAFAADLAARLDGRRPAGAAQRAPARRAARRRGPARGPRRGRSAAPPAAAGPGFRHQPAAYEAPRRRGASPELLEEHFGPVVLLLRHGSREELLDALDAHRRPAHRLGARAGPARTWPTSSAALGERAGRVVFNGFPTGVAVTYGMHHGGPFPATTSAAAHVGRHDRDRPLHAAGRVPGRAGRGAPAGAARGEPARHPPARRRRADARRALGVVPSQVVQLVKPGDRGLVAEGAVWSVMVVMR